MSFTIRAGTLADVPLIAEYNCRLARESEHKELDPETVTAGIRAALADPDRKGPYFLACDGDEIVGQAQITFEWSDWRNGWHWWIQGVYVRADHRGRGVFRALYDAIGERARAAEGVLSLRLYVDRDNHGARATYDRLGMTMLHYDIMEAPLRPVG